MTRPRVLIVDDERLIRWSLEQKLSASGYRVHEAGSGEDALGSIGEAVPDLVLLDVRLPGIDGLEVLRRIKALDPSVVVVMLSAGDALELALSCRAEGAFDYLVKPFDLAEVLRVVERALDAGPFRIVGESGPLRAARDRLSRLASTGDGPVLLLGEPGTGKELFGRVLHEESRPGGGPFLVMRCASLPEHLLEFELFGHERDGSADGAGSRPGILERAGAGTVFLDEVGALRLDLQERLAGVIGARTFRRLGGGEEIPLCARIVAASARDPERGESDGGLGAGLRSAFSGGRLDLPTLGDRREDVALLARHFARVLSTRFERPARKFDEHALADLAAHSWPGNVRDLRAVVERAFLAAERPEIGRADLPAGIRRGGTDPASEPRAGGAEARWAL